MESKFNIIYEQIKKQTKKYDMFEDNIFDDILEDYLSNKYEDQVKLIKQSMNFQLKKYQKKFPKLFDDITIQIDCFKNEQMNDTFAQLDPLNYKNIRVSVYPILFQLKYNNMNIDQILDLLQDNHIIIPHELAHILDIKKHGWPKNNELVHNEYFKKVFKKLTNKEYIKYESCESYDNKFNNTLYRLIVQNDLKDKLNNIINNIDDAIIQKYQKNIQDDLKKYSKDSIELYQYIYDHCNGEKLDNEKIIEKILNLFPEGNNKINPLNIQFSISNCSGFISKEEIKQCFNGDESIVNSIFNITSQGIGRGQYLLALILPNAKKGSSIDLLLNNIIKCQVTLKGLYDEKQVQKNNNNLQTLLTNYQLKHKWNLFFIFDNTKNNKNDFNEIFYFSSDLIKEVVANNYLRFYSQKEKRIYFKK